MSKAAFGLVAFSLVGLVSFAAFADQRDSYDRRGWQNVCRQMVRGKICPTGDCPKGTAQWRQAQIERCMRHYGGVRIRKVGEH